MILVTRTMPKRIASSLAEQKEQFYKKRMPKKKRLLEIRLYIVAYYIDVHFFWSSERDNKLSKNKSPAGDPTKNFK